MQDAHHRSLRSYKRLERGQHLVETFYASPDKLTIVWYRTKHLKDTTHITMTTTNLIASLTVSELHFQTSLVTEYSLVEALSDAGVYMPQDQNRHAPGRPQPKANTVYLWEKGCQLFSGTWNCTTACTKASSEQNLVWNASHDAGLTYHNCLVYPIIAKSAAQNWLDEDSHKLLDKYGIVPDASLPLEVTAREEYERAWPVINGCRRELCHALFPKMKSCPNPPFYGETGLKLGPPDEIWSPQLVNETVHCDLDTADWVNRAWTLDFAFVGMMLPIRTLVGRGYRLWRC